MTRAIWWIRRDLRLTDNQALHAALDQADEVLPVFVLDETLLASPYVGEKRTAFLWDGLRALDAALRERGSSLIVRQGDPVAELARLIHAHDVTAVCAERDITPYARRRDARAARELGQVRLEFTAGLTIRPLDAVRKDDGDPYTVYTPYSKRWKSHPPLSRAQILPAPKHINTPADVTGVAIPDAPALPASVPFPAGEDEAKARLRHFVDGDDAPIFGYANGRDRPDVDATARLSPYLRFGMISPRLAALGAYTARDRAPSKDAAKGAQTWLDELIWREFYQVILAEFPHVRGGAFRPEYDAIAWHNDPDDFAAWCEGRTGYPFVDAAMRQLNATGWMHNRARMVVASFLVKDLLIDWRWGERYFMQQLVDGDPAANNGGWQWTAGTGTDAAPYFRIFNPVTQGEKFDPEGAFVRRWVPELAHVPTKAIHTPWTLARSDQIRAGCRIGEDYPAPVVDHKWARERTLDAYKAVKGE